MTRGHFVGLEYHRALLDDTARVDAYDRAIRALIRPGDVVLDIGTGTGLLAMLAARRGARVHAVESTPMARVARGLIAANGLAERVTVHEADLVTMDPVEPVDVVIGEYMGRLVVDDRMLDAVAAAARWARPAARWCPAEVRVRVAPIGGISLPQVDRWDTTLLGLDLRDALPYALNTAFALQVHEGALLGEPVEVARLAPPAVAGIDADVVLRIEHAGRLQALAGWWEATLAPGVSLGTGPGRATHWGQYVLPLPSGPVLPGDEIHLRLVAPPLGTVATWEGEIVRASGREPFALTTDTQLGERSGACARPAPADPERLYRDGAALLGADPVAARRLLEEASRAAPDALAPAVFEALGLAAWSASDFTAALTAFLRALDGDPLSRPEAARYAVDVLLRTGRPEAAAALAAYEARYPKR